MIMVEAVSKARVAHASAADWPTAAKACLKQLEPIPANASLGFLYLTDAFAPHAKDVYDFFRSHVAVPHWVGTIGVGICASRTEYHDVPAIAVLLLDPPESAFRVFPAIVGDFHEFENCYGDWCEASRPYFGVVHGDPNNGRVPTLVSELAQRLRDGFLVGGLTSSRSAHFQIADGITEGGISGVLFRPDVGVSTRLTQGCTPIGPRHEITVAEQNVIVELNGRPALDVLKDDVGEVLARNLNRAAGYIFAGFPVPGSDTGTYLVRNLIGVDPANKLLAVAEYVEPGNTLMFCRRDGQSARADMVRMLRDVKRDLREPPRAGIYCSCLGRGASLFGANSQELKLIERELGEFPLVGFYANGEISHDRLYGYTGVLTLFSG
jgi:small ligand-binding sensory domain FIST